MSSKDESDHSMTTPVKDSVDEHEESETKEPKVRSGILGLIAIFSSFVLIALALINPFHNNGQYHLDSSTDLTISLKLTSQEFLVITDRNVCDGIGAVAGIKTSTAYASAADLNASSSVGSGQLNDQGECEYTIKIPTADSFKGGTVDFSFKFPFGKSRVFPIDIGKEPPYKTALVTIPLD